MTRPPPDSTDVSNSAVSEEALRTLVVSLNKRYEDVDSRLDQNLIRIEALENEVRARRQSPKTSHSVQPPPTGEKSAAYSPKDSPGGGSSSTSQSSPLGKELYNGGIMAYEGGDYPSAISQFRQFVKAYPSSSLADNALYWIGESYYAEKDFERAISNFLELVDRYPEGNKVPDALLKTGLSYSHMDNPDRAREFLTRVMDNHPFSIAAEKARTNLETID
jgi:tol-pal system protein YbgF